MSDNGCSAFSSGVHGARSLKFLEAWIDDIHSHRKHMSEHIY
jgi:hypothetical protein